jgi:Ca-activated chloride channel family protein
VNPPPNTHDAPTQRASVRGLWWALALLCGLLVGQSAFAPRAHAWEWFRGENGHVRDGNERLRANDAAAALRAYEAAARELPSDPGVHLNRGLALLALAEHDKAREAFLLATEPPAPAAIRAAAYYDLGLAFYRQADAAATAAADTAIAQGAAQPPAGAAQPPAGAAEPPQADHREAQRLFREAADGFRRSLRIQPGNRDAAWNLELAVRRLREEKEAQRREEEQQRQQQEQQEQEQQQQQQDGQQGDSQQDPQQPQDGEQQDPQQQDGQQGQDPQQPPQDGPQPENAQQPENGQPQDQPPQDGQQGQDPQPQPEQPGEAPEPQGGERPQQPAAPSQDGLPAEAARVLDALRDGEENLERYRARARALRENRAPAQDW